MVSFREANQARTSLKMPLSYYSWFKTSSVESESGQFVIVVTTSHIDNAVRDAVPTIHRGVPVRIEPDQK